MDTNTKFYQHLSSSLRDKLFSDGQTDRWVFNFLKVATLRYTAYAWLYNLLG